MTEIADRHEALASRFSELAANVTDWDAPTPVKEWKARDIVAHLCDWLPNMLHGYGVELDETVPDDDPAAAFAEHSANVQKLLEDEEQMTRIVETPQGDQPLANVIESFYLADVFMHQWDLAKASGQQPNLDPVLTHAIIDGMTPIAEQLGASGQFGTPVVLDESHPSEDRLAALIGRDPQWAPAA